MFGREAPREERRPLFLACRAWGAARKEADVRPGLDLSRPSLAAELDISSPRTGGSLIPGLVSLSAEEHRLLGALQARRHPMTVRQLERSLSSSTSVVEQGLAGLLERRVIVRLNTLIPSYDIRHGAVDLDVH